MRIQALKAYEEAKQFYLELLFATGSDAKMGVGYILDQLARAIAFSYHGYFKHSQTDQLAELQEIASRSQKPLPEDFCKRYREILLEKEEAVQKVLRAAMNCFALSNISLATKPSPPGKQHRQSKITRIWQTGMGSFPIPGLESVTIHRQRTLCEPICGEAICKVN